MRSDTDAATSQLFRRIEARRDDLVALTQALIRIPTVNPPGDVYTDCAELIGRRLAARGFAVEYVRAEGAAGDSDRYPRTNVVARIEAPRPGPCVHFNGHIDVVPAGQGWTVDPFGGVVRDGRVYGRGACDMKGGIAASIIAVESLLEEGLLTAGALAATWWGPWLPAEPEGEGARIVVESLPPPAAPAARFEAADPLSGHRDLDLLIAQVTGEFPEDADPAFDAWLVGALAQDATLPDVPRASAVDEDAASKEQADAP